jgi:hypothetical protein
MCGLHWALFDAKVVRIVPVYEALSREKLRKLQTLLLTHLSDAFSIQFGTVYLSNMIYCIWFHFGKFKGFVFLGVSFWPSHWRSK